MQVNRVATGRWMVQKELVRRIGVERQRFSLAPGDVLHAKQSGVASHFWLTFRTFVPSLSRQMIVSHKQLAHEKRCSHAGWSDRTCGSATFTSSTTFSFCGEVEWSEEDGAISSDSTRTTSALQNMPIDLHRATVYFAVIDRNRGMLVKLSTQHKGKRMRTDVQTNICAAHRSSSLRGS